MTNSTKDLKIAEHFDDLARAYADAYTNGSFASYFVNRRLNIVFDFLKHYDLATVLDVGCGPGMMAEYCVEKDFKFFGIDISEKMIDECINRFGHMNSTHFSVGKLQKLDFSDAFFDVVLCMGVLEYIDAAELDDAVSEMARVLKPGGTIIVSLMNENSFFVWNRRWRNSLLERLTGQKCDAESYDELSRSFDESNFRSLLNLNHFSDIQVDFFALNLFPSFLEEKVPTKLRVLLSKGLESVIRNRLTWPYMAFIVKARKQY